MWILTQQVNYCLYILHTSNTLEKMHQLFTDLKKAYDSVGREVLYNILNAFGIPMKLVKANKNVSK